MTKDRTVDLFKRLIETGGRTVPAAAEPLVEGSSLHAEDVRFILDELQARHAVELTPNEADALEETKKPAGKGPAAAPAGRSSAPPTSDPEDEDELPEESEEDRTRSRKLRSRLAQLERDIAELTKGKK